jgi:hypothetical protein
LVQKSEWKKSSKRLRHDRRITIKIDLNEIGCEAWNELNWLRVESSVFCCKQSDELQVLQKTGERKSSSEGR